MTKLSPSKVLGLALGCATLVLGAIYVSADPKPSESKHFYANAGTTFVLLPAKTTGGPRSHNIDGVVRISSADLLGQPVYSRIAGYEDVNLGDCSFHGTANLVATANPDFFLITDGLFLFTSADGKSSLTHSESGESLYGRHRVRCDVHGRHRLAGGRARLWQASRVRHVHDHRSCPA